MDIDEQIEGLRDRLHVMEQERNDLRAELKAVKAECDQARPKKIPERKGWKRMANESIDFISRRTAENLSKFATLARERDQIYALRYHPHDRRYVCLLYDGFTCAVDAELLFGLVDTLGPDLARRIFMASLIEHPERPTEAYKVEFPPKGLEGWEKLKDPFTHEMNDD